MIDVAALLHSWTRVPPDIRRLVDTFMSPAGKGRRFALGRNEHALAVSKIVELDGFVDDYAEPGTVWHGKPVIRGADIPANGIVINCSMCISPVSAARRLAGLHVAGVLALSDLCRALPDAACLPDFIQETRQDLAQHQDEWGHLSESFADDRSRAVLDGVISYRVTGDYNAMSAYAVRLKDQYFEDFLNLARGEVFVDAGGYDGDTTEEFIKRCPGYGKVFLFEPSAENLSKARMRLRDARDVDFINLGLSDSAGTLSFDPSAGSASSVSEAGTSRIAVTTLDRHIPDKITFIKMDLEGWELKALEGSRRHILEDHPKLAIAVYHHPSHFRLVFDFVKGARPDYRCYLRHYTEGWSETVMYFVPGNDERGR